MDNINKVFDDMYEYAYNSCFITYLDIKEEEAKNSLYNEEDLFNLHMPIIYFRDYRFETEDLNSLTEKDIDYLLYGDSINNRSRVKNKLSHIDKDRFLKVIEEKYNTFINSLDTLGEKELEELDVILNKYITILGMKLNFLRTKLNDDYDIIDNPSEHLKLDEDYKILTNYIEKFKEMYVDVVMRKSEFSDTKHVSLDTFINGKSH